MSRSYFSKKKQNLPGKIPKKLHTVDPKSIQTNKFSTKTFFPYNLLALNFQELCKLTLHKFWPNIVKFNWNHSKVVFQILKSIRAKEMTTLAEGLRQFEFQLEKSSLDDLMSSSAWGVKNKFVNILFRATVLLISACLGTLIFFDILMVITCQTNLKLPKYA
jgi:hypothetical protein